MKKIPLTQGKFALVNDIDYEYLMQWKWYYHQGYAVRGSRKAEGFGKRKTIYMHRVILNQILGHDNFPETDHKNEDKRHNKLDNRRDNLRPSSYSENGGNSKPIDGSSTFKGVCWHKQTQKWRAQIKVNGKSKHLGLFDDEVDAAKAYNKAAIEHFGEFAYLNDL